MKLRMSVKPLGGPFDLAALVDVMFILVIFLLLGSSLVVRPGVPLDLPDRVAGYGASSNLRVLTIDGNRQIFFNDERSNLGRLPAQMKEFAEAGVGQTVLMKVDRAVPYGLVMEVQQLIMSAGINVVQATAEMELEKR